MMPKPSFFTFCPTETRLVSLCAPRLSLRPNFRRYPVQRARYSTSLSATRVSIPPIYPRTIVHRRKMSTPADHKPLKQAPKTPPVPRPSARYVAYNSHSETPRPNDQKCSCHFAKQPDTTSPPRQESLQLRLRSRLPGR